VWGCVGQWLWGPHIYASVTLGLGPFSGLVSCVALLLVSLADWGWLVAFSVHRLGCVAVRLWEKAGLLCETKYQLSIFCLILCVCGCGWLTQLVLCVTCRKAWQLWPAIVSSGYLVCGNPCIYCDWGISGVAEKRRKWKSYLVWRKQCNNVITSNGWRQQHENLENYPWRKRNIKANGNQWRKKQKAKTEARNVKKRRKRLVWKQCSQ